VKKQAIYYYAVIFIHVWCVLIILTWFWCVELTAVW